MIVLIIERIESLAVAIVQLLDPGDTRSSRPLFWGQRVDATLSAPVYPRSQHSIRPPESSEHQSNQ